MHATKMALEDEYGSCAVEDQNFNTSRIALLLLELVLGLGLMAVECIIYRKIGASVPSAVPSPVRDKCGAQVLMDH